MSADGARNAPAINPRRTFLKGGQLVQDYDALEEYLSGRDHVTAFIRTLRSRNQAYAQCSASATSEAGRNDAVDRHRRGADLAQDLDIFQAICEMHGECMARIARVSLELRFNGFAELSIRLLEDLEADLRHM